LSPVTQPFKGRDFIKAANDGISKNVKIAYCPDIAGIGIDPDIEKVCRKAALEITQIGSEAQEIELDLSFAKQAYAAIRGHWMVAHHHKHLGRIEQLGDNLRGNIQSGLKVTMEEFAKAEQTRGKVWLKFKDFFEKYDYLLTPTMAVPPFSAEQNYPTEIAGKKMKTYIDWFAPTFLLSLTGLPVASVPCGLDQNNLPVGIQIVGSQFGEEKVLALAKQMQDANPITLPELNNR
jgi:amidase